MTRKVTFGSPIKVVDEHGVEHDGLVTNVWPHEAEYDDSKPVSLALNVVFVSGDDKMTDQYGRQIERLTSCMHKSSAGTCPGRYWFQP